MGLEQRKEKKKRRAEFLEKARKENERKVEIRRRMREIENEFTNNLSYSQSEISSEPIYRISPLEMEYKKLNMELDDLEFEDRVLAAQIEARIEAQGYNRGRQYQGRTQYVPYQRMQSRKYHPEKTDESYYDVDPIDFEY